jgi:hypothetical protein
VAEVDGVPKEDGGDREVEARGTVALVFEGAVPDLAVTMEKQGAGERVPGLAFIEPGIERRLSAGSEIQSRMKRAVRDSRFRAAPWLGHSAGDRQLLLIRMFQQTTTYWGQHSADSLSFAPRIRS